MATNGAKASSTSGARPTDERPDEGASLAVPETREELASVVNGVADALHAVADDQALSEQQVEEGLHELRSLLFSGEQAELAQLRERIHNPQVRAQDLSEVLAEAVALRSQGGEALVQALTPNVEGAIEASIRRNPQLLADVFFPIMGPAIRKAIAAALEGMMQSLNQTLEHSLSPQSVKWRIESARTGKPFAEIVLLNTLLYRVEQVFLIHRETGLLLQHVAAHEVEVQDADMVSGMLTAIQDFARDSFAAGAGDTLETVDIGELTVWVEQGPLAVLAGAIRGTPPEDLRDKFRNALEQIHREQGAALATFNGDISPFETARPHLESCLESRYGKTEVPASEVPKRKKPPFPIAAGFLAALVVVPLFFHFQAARRWDAYLSTLRRTPGIVIVDSGVSGGAYYVRGLRDPLAPNPQALLQNTGIKPDGVKFILQPYQSLDAPFVLARAQRILKPPHTVTMQLEGETLRISGTASPEWIKTARWVTPLIPGVSQLDDTLLRAEKE